MIITHQHIGRAMLEAVENTFGKLSLPAAAICVNPDSKAEAILDQANQIIRQIDQGDGVLIFTDIIGSTPSNIAHQLHSEKNTSVVSGLSLSMLLRVFNYPEASLAELTNKAVSAAREGVTCLC